MNGLEVNSWSTKGGQRTTQWCSRFGWQQMFSKMHWQKPGSLQICVKLKQYIVSVSKTHLQNDCIFTDWCYVTKNMFSPLTLSHSKKPGDRFSKFCLVYLNCMSCTNVIKLSLLLLQRFLFSIRYLCLRVLHYFEHNMCYGFWKPLSLISISVSSSLHTYNNVTWKSCDL